MSLRSLKLLLAGVICCFVLATSYISYLIVERQNALKQVSRYNTSWLASQAVSEFTLLAQRISALNLPGSGIDKDEVQLRFDIVLNRVKLLNGGEFERFVAREPERAAAVETISGAVTALRPLIEQIDKPEAVQQALEVLQPLHTTLAGLASAANRFGADRVAEDQQQLLRLHWLFSSMAAGLAICGVGLMALLAWHNRLLGRAHRAVHDLAQNLQSTSGELEDANKALSDAYTELQFRNELLQGREVELRTQNERFDAALNNMSHGLCMVDGDERLVVHNEQFSKLFGLVSRIPAGTPFAEFPKHLHHQNGGDAETLRLILNQHRRFSPTGRRSNFVHREGRVFSVSHQPMPNGGWLATYDDITERTRAEERISYMAHHDALTDLANRVLFRQQIEAALSRAKRDRATIAISFIDLDRFKDVNDTLGHQAGDLLLRAAADRLRSCVRDGDLVSRLGGDEFAVLQVGQIRRRDCASAAARIIRIMGAPYDLDGQEVTIGATIGIALDSGGSTDPEGLLKQADLALYRAKNEGRGTFCFFEAEMDAQLQARYAMERDLRKAVENSEFELYYQPQVSASRREITGFEALLRWRHPEQGMVMPSDFIETCENMGLISRMGEWVLEQACMQAATWPTQARVAVNLSPAQFRGGNLVHVVRRILASSGLEASRLELEITESALLQENAATLAILCELRSLGVRIAMDDFGTGYSSLSYLRSFPFDRIKIDRCFVQGLSNQDNSLAIVQSVIALANSLGMATTAEGVETEDQLLLLRTAGCTDVQGYYFGKPRPAGELMHSIAALRAAAEAA